jgi:hypothetical protein
VSNDEKNQATFDEKKDEKNGEKMMMVRPIDDLHQLDASERPPPPSAPLALQLVPKSLQQLSEPETLNPRKRYPNP